MHLFVRTFNKRSLAPNKSSGHFPNPPRAYSPVGTMTGNKCTADCGESGQGPERNERLGSNLFTKTDYAQGVGPQTETICTSHTE